SAVEGLAESSVRMLAKVVQVMPARLRRQVEALGTSGRQPRQLGMTLRSARIAADPDALFRP
ncbi:hypothetical protein AB0I41_34765, partial [Micromonospora sp. NPDC050200]